MIWYSLTILFFVLEVMCRKGYFFWFAMLAFFNYLWFSSIPIFLFSAAIASLSWYAYMNKKPKVYEALAYDRDSSRYVGREFVLTRPMRDGISHIEFDEMLWPVYSMSDAEELPVGTWMKVRRTNGVILMSEPLTH